jgi:hypothetical protein
MCNWGETELLAVTIPKHLSHTGKSYQKTVDIDKCIYPIVKALNQGGISTIASCCGHGKIPGSIILEDNKELIITDFNEARELFKSIGYNIHGERTHNE